jgi:zinc protease
MQLVRRACALLFALILGACAQAGSAAPNAQRGDARPEYTYWPHEISDIAPDPAVRFGVLPNGMRYALMRNNQPAGTISLRFRIASGSLQESDAQQGLAHFMEHMAFNGSKNVPEGDFVKLLQRKGLAFGADTNAYTSTEETVYMLELPKNATDLVDTGLMLFREIGDRLALDPAAIEREKGVVLSELRTRNTPEYRAYEDRWRLSYEGQRQSLRLPIGTAETIQGATRELLVDYYSRFYRPERTVLVATGGDQPKSKRRSSEFRIGRPRVRSVGPWWGNEGRGLTAVSHVEANLPSLTVTWFRPADDEPDTVALRARNLHRRVALAVLNRRLARLARADNAPFVSAGAGYGNSRGLSQTVGFSLSTRPGQWQRGLDAVEQEYRRALQYGFAANEVTREVKEWRASLEEAVATQSTRDTKSLADQLTGSFDDRSVFSAPVDQLARFEKIAPAVTPESALAGLHDVAGGQGPVIFLSSSQPVVGGNAAIASAYEGSVKAAVALSTKEDAKTFPYVTFGVPGAVAERREIADVGVTAVRFANGVMLNVKSTAFEKDTVYVTVRVAGGYVRLPRNKIGLALALPFGFSEGGLKQLTADELEEALAGRIVSNALSLDEESFELSGGTNGRDLLLQLQLLAAFTTDPAYRSGGLERLQVAAENFLKQYSSGPSRVLERETSALLRSGDARWQFPDIADVRALKMTDVEGVLKPVLASAPIEITVVGDAKADDVIRAVAATFGALPPRGAKRVDPPSAREVKFPANARALRFTHEGRPDQAAAFVAWSAPDFYSSPRRARATAILRELMEVRLTEEFREAQGATYSPSVRSWNSGALPDFGYIAASAETPPDLVASFYKTVDKIVAELRSGAFSDDVLERAREPLEKSVETDRLSNGFWLGALEDIQSEPRALDVIRTQLSDLQSITKDEVVAAAKQYLGGRRLEVRVFPDEQK